jgi:hypothetical protein
MKNGEDKRLQNEDKWWQNEDKTMRTKIWDKCSAHCDAKVLTLQGQTEEQVVPTDRDKKFWKMSYECEWCMKTGKKEVLEINMLQEVVQRNPKT